MLNVFRKRGPLFVLQNIFDWATGQLPHKVPNAYQQHDQQMLFKLYETRPDKISASEMNSIASRIKAFRDEFAKSNVRFVFVPVPSKESIYLPGLEDRGWKIQEMLLRSKALGVEYVDIQTPFLSEASMHPKQLIYQLDDTHWNEAGVSLAADHITKKLQ